MKNHFYGILALVLVFLTILCQPAHASYSKIDSLRWVLEHEAPNWPPEDLGPLFLELAQAYSKNEESQKALDQLMRGLEIVKIEKQGELEQQFYLQMGQTYFQLHDYSEALRYFRIFLSEVGGKNSSPDVTMAHSYISKIQLANGDYDQAYKSATTALLLQEQSSDSLGISFGRMELGDIHFKQEHYILALNEYHLALEIAEIINNDSALHQANSVLSKTYKNLDKKDKALFYNRKALNIAEANNNFQAISKGKKNNAQLYIELGLYEKAAEYFYDALKMELDRNDLQEQVNSYMGLGKAYVRMGEAEKSLYYLGEAQCIAERLELPRELSNIFAILAEANAMLGRESDGYYFLKSHVAIRDTLIKEVALKEMGEIKNQYELESRENQIALLQAERNLLANEKKIKGLYWFLLAAFVAFFLITGFVVVSKSKMQSRLFTLLEHKSQKIKEQNLKLAQSNLDLQQFASIASHDLREPLRMINSYTKLLDRKYNKSFDSTAKEFMNFITDAATRMDRMLTDLFDYSRAQNKGEVSQWVSSAELVEIALDNLKYKIEQRKVHINFEKSHLPKLYCNKTAMIQLFQNLIGNAVKFTNESNPEVIINCTKKGGHYFFSIKDNGIGIEKQDQSKIFDMFQRLHSQQEFEGTGIGLATCKKIVERHKGKIWVESEAGEGSTFFFSIPQDVSSN